MLRSLRHRDFRWLLSSLAVSATGDWLYSVALIVYVFDRTGSPTWVAVTTVAVLLPYVLLGAVGGALADRRDHRSLLIATDVIRAAVMFALAAVMVASGPVALAIVLATVSTVAATPARPTVAAALPAMVGEEDLAAGNSLRETIENLALLAGPALGGLLLTVGTPGVVVTLNGLTFLASAVLVTRIRFASREDVQPDEETPSLVERFFEGVAAVRRDRGVVAIVVLIGAETFLYGMTGVLYVLAADQLLGLGTEGFGYMLAAAGCGGVLAAGLSSRLANGDPGRTLVAAGVLIAVPSVTLAVTRRPLVALIVLLVEGGAGIVIDVLAVTVLQRTIDQRILGQVLGMFDSIAAVGTLVGSFAAPVAVGLFGLTGALVCCGAVTAATAAAVSPRLLAVGRAARARAAQLASVIALVERMRIFDGATRTTIEGVAAALERHEVAAGDVVVREGEPADALYLIETGVFDVISTGELSGPSTKINELRAGDYFGEIGLLEHIPRTATVRCTRAGVVHRLDGAAFLDVVTQAPVVSGSLRAAAAARLTRTHPGHRVLVDQGPATSRGAGREERRDH